MQAPITYPSESESGHHNSGGRPEAVSFEEVKKAFERVLASGKSPTLTNVHAVVGHGSRSTVHKHWSELREKAGPVASLETPAVPSHLLRAVAGEIDRQVLERTSSLATDLEDARQSLELVVAETETVRHALADAEGLLTAHRLELAGRDAEIAALRAQIEGLRAELSSATEASAGARQELALALEQHRSAEQHTMDLKEERAALKSELAELRAELKVARAEAEARGRDCVSYQAQLVNAEETKERAKEVQTRADALQAKLEDTVSRLSGLDAERLSLIERLSDSKCALARAEATIEKLLSSCLGGFNRNELGEARGGRPAEVVQGKTAGPETAAGKRSLADG